MINRNCRFDGRRCHGGIRWLIISRCWLLWQIQEMHEKRCGRMSVNCRLHLTLSHRTPLEREKRCGKRLACDAAVYELCDGRTAVEHVVGRALARPLHRIAFVAPPESTAGSPRRRKSSLVTAAALRRARARALQTREIGKEIGDRVVGSAPVLEKSRRHRGARVTTRELKSRSPIFDAMPTRYSLAC